ncbi:MAG: TonB-dependent receptor [Alphaproteobacteria bacterium]
MDEIVVTGGRLAGARAASTLFSFDAEGSDATRAGDLSGVLRFAPSAAIQTNSRGETLVYLRGAGERQTALFFAGAPINIPWDNRFNLDLFPAGALSDIHITSGPASVLFGANTAGGVIELSPTAFSLSPRGAFRAQGADGGLWEISADGAAAFGPVEITAAASHLSREGETLSEAANLPFFQDPAGLRTNTDLRRTNGLVRIAFDQSGPLRISASVLAVDSAFGIAPEGNEDPILGRPRFWRFPDSHMVLGVLNAGYQTRSGFDVSSAFWVQQAGQTIDSFASDAYTLLEDTQQDRDRTVGLRTVMVQDWGRHALRGSFSIADARHEQTDRAFDAAAVVEDETAVFRRRTFSLGAEYEITFGALSLMAGAGGDILQSRETGGRDSAGGLAAWSVIGAVNWQIDDRWSLSASAGRKPRLPTQRELFGEAVGRFLLNPDLGPEIPIQVEAAVQYEGERIRFTVTPFATFTDGTIDQQTVILDGVSRRQRINLEGSRAFGVDMEGRAEITDRLTLSGHVSLLNLRRRGDTEGLDARFIAERPSLLGLIAADYRDPSGARVRLEALRRGRAFSLGDDGFVALPRSTQVNLELAFAPPLPSRMDVEVFLRANNLADARVEPQLGLPAPGRTVRGGIRIAFE